MRDKILIYLLIDPLTDEIKYVGKTKDINIRMTNHMCPSQLKAKTHKNHWLKKIAVQNMKPVVLIIDEAHDVNTANTLESYWIEQFRIWGIKLTNGTPGGDGATLTGRKRSPETIEKVRLANIGRVLSDETKAKISKSVSKTLIGNKRAVGSKGWVGKKHKKESIDKMKLSHPYIKPVLMCDKQGNIIKEFPSIHEASRQTNIYKTTISRCCQCRPHYNTGGGYIWKFKLS